MAKSRRLHEYHSKRDFNRTTEPPAKVARARKNKLAFLVQKHDARRLHYDFRLEWQGVLLSWAVTKGPSLNPADKRLAVQTEDHPMSYGDFEGVIPKGEYGGGTVMLWDQGTWEPVGDPSDGLKSGKLKFRLLGERMQGGWSLIRMRDDARAKKSGKQNWLLIKEKDEFANQRKPITDQFTSSVASARSMKEIEIQHHTYKPKEKRKTPAATSSNKRNSNPKFVKPQLATLVADAPSDDNWIFETKFDGYRALVSVGKQGTTIYTRSGLDWTEKFSNLSRDINELDCKSALIDGEIIAESRGRVDFSQLQRTLKEGGELVFYAFDILHLNGKDLTHKPLLSRKTELEKVFGKSTLPSTVRLSAYLQGNGEEAFKKMCNAGGEGIVCKRADATYVSKRDKKWLKVKCTRRQEFVIIGFSPSDKRGRPFASILLGQYKGSNLIYRGRVGTGFDQDALDDLYKKFKQITIDYDKVIRQSKVEGVPASVTRTAKWVTPTLVVEVDFTELTADGNVRHGVFLGLREDKKANTIKPEFASDQTASSRMTKSKSQTKNKDSEYVAGIKISHPDREVFPRANLKKIEVAEYYAHAAERMIAIAGKRPLSLVRCPQGINKECFFQRHATKGFPEQWPSVELEEKNGKSADYLYTNLPEGFISAAQMGVLEFHMWGSRNDRLEKPDRLVFDLDPDPTVSFEQVKESAFMMKDMLESLGLNSACLLTGGKGVHLCVSLNRTVSWQTLKLFAKTFATIVAEREPSKYTATQSKAKRKGKIYIDWLRNEKSATAIVPYSVRARDGAPVAAPIEWHELPSISSANTFCVGAMTKRLNRPCPYLQAMKQLDSITHGVIKKLEKLHQ